MTTRYATENQRLPAWRYTQDLDAREALKQIEAQRSCRSTRRFRGESLGAWRIRVGLSKPDPVISWDSPQGKSLIAAMRPRRSFNWSLLLAVAGVALFWGLIATIFIKSLN